MKSKLKVLLMLILCLTTAIFSINFINSESILTSANHQNEKVIIIDPGHGGFDGGAVAYDGTVEKDINLNICLALSDMLSSVGYKVILTRSTDNATDNLEKGSIAQRKKSDLNNRLNLMKDFPQGIFVSIHLNKFTTTAARGSQVFYNGKIPESEVLGDKIQKSIVSMLQPDNTRVNKLATTSTYVLYNATIPAVLVECGFLSNAKELELLKDKEYQKKLAFCCFSGIIDYIKEAEVA